MYISSHFHREYFFHLLSKKNIFLKKSDKLVFFLFNQSVKKVILSALDAVF